MPTLLAEIPQSFGTYIEPFLGGGSLFFALQPERAILSDANGELINAYEQVRDRPTELQRWLRWLEVRHSKETYYTVRSRSGGGHFWRALRFIYLNRTCWNGLYRVNVRGDFNVPMGTKVAVSFEDGLENQSNSLKDAVIEKSDFRQVIRRAQRADFVYVDPPYTVRHNNNGFLKYNEKIFSWADQEALKDEICHAVGRGVKVLVSNAAHDSIKELYRDIGTLIEVERSSVLAASSNFRRREKEVLIKCY